MRGLNSNAAMRAAMMAVIVLMALSGCTSATEPLPDPESEEVEPITSDYNQREHEELKVGGTLTTAINGIESQHNQWHVEAGASTRELWGWYNPVTHIQGPSGEPEPNPDYFTSVRAKTIDGSTQVTYTLNEAATFNDGTPIDWRALQSVWQVCGTVGRGCQADLGYQQIKSVEKGEDAKQAVVTFHSVYPWWPGLFDRLLHPDAVDSFGTAYVGQAHPEWGAGPYKVQYIDGTADKASFVPNEKWWGDRGVLEERKFIPLGRGEEVTAFLAGKIDVARVNDGEQLERVQAAKGVEVRRGTNTAPRVLTLNGRRKPFDDPAVREALWLGTDRESLAGIAFHGLDHTEALPGSFVLLPHTEGYRDNFGAAVQFDVRRARQMLDGAGWTPGSDGIRERNGERLEIDLLVPRDDEAIAAAMRAYTSMMKDIGVELRVHSRPRDEIDRAMGLRDFDMAFSFHPMRGTDAAANVCHMWCRDSAVNASGVADPDVVDQITRQMLVETSREGQARIANNAETKGFGQHGVMPLYLGPDIWATRSGLANMGATAHAQPRIEDIGWQK